VSAAPRTVTGIMRSLRILFVTPYVPSPLRPRPYNFIKHLSHNGHRIVVLAVATSRRDHTDIAALRPYCERLEVFPVSFARSVANALRGVATTLPLQAVYARSPALEARLAAEVNDASSCNSTPAYDVAHIEHLRAALSGLQLAGIPLLYDSVDCISSLLERTATGGATAAARWRARIDLDRTKRFEARLLRSFDRILITSPRDRRDLLGLAGGQASAADKVVVLPNGVDLDYFQPIENQRMPATLVYVGRMSYHANVTAVLRLTREIMPRVWAQRPDARLQIVGSEPSRAVRRLATRDGTRVTITGHVPDIRPYLSQATASVFPLVYAAGIQNKVLESMAMQTPLVATPAACTALQIRHNREVLLADDTPAFAAEVVRLLADEALQRRLGSAGRAYVEQHHRWFAIVGQLEKIYGDLHANFRKVGDGRAQPKTATEENADGGFGRG
jgi:polysaccharide biosynthesis protein PslH